MKRKKEKEAKRKKEKQRKEKKEQETYEREFFIRGVNQNGISFKFGFCRCDSSRSSRGRGSNRLRSALKKENKIEMKSY